MNDLHNVFNYRIGSLTSALGRPPVFYRSDLLQSKGCAFGSVYAVRREDAEAISLTAGTAAGFKGIVWSQRLWVDFDNTEGALQARKLLKEQGYDYVEYDTGGRGSHFGIRRDCNPSHILPLLDKHWVKENMPLADLSLYWHLHLIRLPGAVHERTGRTKTLVTRQPGQALILPNVLPDDEGVKQAAASEGKRRESIFSCWQVVSLLTGAGINGSRHRHLLDLVLALKNDCMVSMDESMWVVREVNRGFEEPKAEEEVEKIVKWAYEKD